MRRAQSRGEHGEGKGGGFTHLAGQGPHNFHTWPEATAMMRAQRSTPTRREEGGRARGKGIHT